MATAPDRLIRTSQLVLRRWEPEDAPLLKAAIDMSLAHFLGTIHFTRMANRPMFSVELIVDDHGHRYVRISGRAYIHGDDRMRR